MKQPLFFFSNPQGFASNAKERHRGMNHAGFLFLSLFMLLALCGNAQVTWTGATDTDWHTATNWNMSNVPVAVDDVVIPNVANLPIINAAAVAQSVTVNTGASLTVSAGDTLTLDGETGTSSLFNSGTVNNSGTINIGPTTTAGTFGVLTNGTFNNNAGSHLNINNSSAEGLHSSSPGTFVNNGTITVGAIASVGGTGVLAQSVFTNSATGHININRYTTDGLWVDNTFSNSGTIDIGTAVGGSRGVEVTGTLNNFSGGFIRINGVSNASIQNDGTLNNYSTITVGDLSMQSFGGTIVNQATFNNISGKINIDRASSGVSSLSGIFNNSDSIVMGAIVPVMGLIDSGTNTFSNDAGGFVFGDGPIQSSTLINNGGTLSPRTTSPGIMSFDAAEDFANSTIEIGVDGAGAAGTDFDKIVVSGAATLGGNMAVSINYAATSGDVITIMDATSLTGTFTFSPALPAGWAAVYNSPNAGEVSLVFSGASIQSAQTGNWNTGSTWVGGVVPTSADNAIIKAGHQVTAGGILNFASLLIETTGILDASGNVTYTSTGSITNNGTINFKPSGGSTHNVNCNLINFGTVNWTGWTMNSGNGSTLTNHGILNLSSSNQTWTGLNIVNESGGQVTRTSPGTTTMAASITNNAGGTFTLAAGAAMTQNGNLTNSGDFGVSGTLNMTSGSHTFIGSGYTFGGTGTLNLSNTTVTATSGFVPAFATIIHLGTITGGASTAMVIPVGTMFNSDGNTTLQGFTSITNNGTVTFTAGLGSAHNINCDFINNGTFNWSRWTINSSNGSTLTNNGILNLSSPNNIWQGLHVVNASGGHINRTAGGSSTVSSNFTNNAGGSVTVNTMATLNISTAATHAGLFVVEPTATLNFSNTVTNTTITAPLFANNGTVLIGGARSLVFAGTALQTIPGNGAITALTVNNTSHLAITGTQTLSGALTLTAGNVVLGTNDLMVGSTTGGSAGSYVQTNGNGRLKRTVTTASQNFPVGTGTSYNPVLLDQVSGTAVFGVRVKNGFTTPTVGADFVNHEWVIDYFSGTANTAVTLQWNSPGDELGAFAPASSYVSRWDGTAWTASATGAAVCGSGVCSRIATGMTMFGSFGVASGTSLQGPAVLTASALHFDGVDDYVELASSSSLDFERTDQFSIEFWIKTTSVAQVGIISKMVPSGTYRGYDVTIDVGKIVSHVVSSWPTQLIKKTSSLTVNDGNWHHVAMTYNGSSVASGMKLFIDGIEDTGTIVNYNNLTSGTIKNTLKLRMGERGGLFINASLDEVRIWSRDLCGAEILAQKNCGLTGTETGLSAYYKFNQGVVGANNAVVTTLNDLTPNGFNGTLNNFALTGATSNWVDGTANGVTGSCTPGSCQIPFVTTWQTTGSYQSITIPTTGGGYSYAVNWGDGTATSGHTGNATHAYATAGIHTVSITGSFPRIYFNSTGDRLKIKSIEQWGEIAWSSMANAFAGCANLTYNATDAPDLTGVTDLSSMFANASLFNGNITGWSVSGVTNMGGMFATATSFNQNISGWDVSNVTNMTTTFAGATTFNQDISGWVMTSVTNLQGMFAGATAFNQNISTWNVANVSNMQDVFNGATAFDQNLSSWNIANVTDMQGMLNNSDLSVDNYDVTLAGWSVQSVQPNVPVGALGLGYCLGEPFRLSLITTHGWTFTGDSPETVPPVAVCPPFTLVFLDAAGNGTLPANALVFGDSYDDCSTVTETSALTNYSCTDLGIQQVNLVATDENGNIGTLGCEVVVLDTIAPVITFCPADIIVAADPGECGVVNIVTGVPTATDNCPGITPVLINGTTPPYSFFVGERGALGGSNAGSLSGMFYDGTRQVVASLPAADGVIMDSPTSVIASRFNPAGANLVRVDLLTGLKTDIATLGGLLQGMSLNTAGNLLVTNEGLKKIQEVVIATGAATNVLTGLNRPIDVVEETPTTLLISEYNLGQILRRNLTTNTTTVLSTGHVRPTDILLDGAGSAYVAENGGAVSKVNLTTGVRTVVVNVGGGTFGPHGLAFDENDDLLITVFSANQIKKWDGIVLTTFATGMKSPVFIVKAPTNIFTAGVTPIVWTVEDASGNASTCIQNITVTSTVACANDAQVLDFDGVNDYVDLGIWEPYGPAGFTQEAWVYAQNLGPDDFSNSVILQEGPTGTSTILRVGQNGANNVRASFHYGPGINDLYDLDGVITTNTWHHLAMTWNATSTAFSLYVDGALAQTMLAPNPPNSVNEEIWIGNSEIVPDRWFDGRMDEVRIWNYARTQAQIQANLLQELNGTEPGLLAYYNFNQGQSFQNNPGVTTLEDFNGNHNGTLNNFQLTAGNNSNWIEPGPMLAAAPSTGFVTTWEVTAGDPTISILTGNVGYNYSINWGDGIIDNGMTGTASHTYADPGVYTVSIQGTFPFIYFTYNAVDRLQLKSIEQWGDIAWKGMVTAFQGCANMVNNATDAPDLSNVTDLTFMFGGCASFTGDLSNWDVSNVTNMRLMFSGSGFNGNVSTWNTSNVTNMGDLFRSSPFNGDVSNWDVTKVTNMAYMFALGPFNQPLSNWERVGSSLGNVQNTAGMFSGNSQFNQNISNWNVGNVGNMAGMFYRAHAYNQPLNTWNVANVGSMGAMFREAFAFNQPLGNWNTGKVTSMGGMFANAYAFNQNLSTWDVSKVANMQGMFNAATAFNQHLAAWNITKLTNAIAMLPNSGMSNANYDLTLIGWGAQDPLIGIPFGATGKKYCTGELARQRLIDDFGWNVVGDSRDPGCAGSPPPPAPQEPAFVTTWQTTAAGESITIPTKAGLTYDYYVDWGDGNVETDLTGNATHAYATPDLYTVKIGGLFPRIHFNNENGPNKNKIKSIEAWGDIVWGDMILAFGGCGSMAYHATDAPDLSGVTSTSGMFVGCHSFNSGSLSNWDMTTITDISDMFSCSEFNGDVSGWNTSSITNMHGVFQVTPFNGSLENWDVSSVTDMSMMFRKNFHFNQDIGSWDVSSVVDMNRMFLRATAFNQDIGNWDVSSVTNMHELFSDGCPFNQNIGGWDVSNVTDMSQMFRKNSKFNQDISGWDVSSVYSMIQMFEDATGFNQDISSWDVAGVEQMESMFELASSFDQSLGGWEMSGNKNLWRMLNYCGMSVANYDNTLVGWAGQVATMNNRNLGASNLKFCASELARDYLRDEKGWKFIGDAISPVCAGACNCNPNISPLIPNTAGGLHTAFVKCTDGAFTHYCDNLGRLLLSLSSDVAATIAPTDVTVNITPGTRYYEQFCTGSGGTEDGTCFISNEDGAVILCRTWQVTSAQTNATVRYYFDDKDIEIVNNGIASLGLDPLTDLNQMWFYKVNGGAGHEKPEDLTISEINLIDNDGTGVSSFTNWALGGTALNNHYAEYKVPSFSGGGGGGAQKGSSPICPVIEATISGTTVLMAPGNADVAVNVTGGTGPYTVILLEETADSTAVGTPVNNYISGAPLSVTASNPTNYTIQTVIDANGCPHSNLLGTASVYFATDDDTPPIAICQDITVDLDTFGMGSISVLDIDNGSFDNDAIASMVLDQYSFNCTGGSSDVVTLTVTDVSGNFQQCSAIVTINDEFEFCCPAVREVTNAPTTAKFYEADQQIVSDAVVKLGTGTTSIIFEAGNNVLLNPGFEVKQGAVFEAKIGPCGD